jgi:hypothetical protein
MLNSARLTNNQAATKECRTMKRHLTALALGLVLGTTAFTTASPAAAQSSNGVVLHGCVITAGDDYVVVRASGAGGGPNGVFRIQTSNAVNYDPATTQDACGAIVIYQQDGVWYAESFSVTRDDSGEIETNSNSGSRPVLHPR